MEAAAVLDLHEGPRPVDPGAAVGDAGDLRPRDTGPAGPDDLHARERRERPVEWAVRRLEAVGRQPEQPLDLREQVVLLLVRDEKGGRIDRAERDRVHLD